MFWDYYGEIGCCLYCSHDSTRIKGYKADKEGNCQCNDYKCDKCGSYNTNLNDCEHLKTDSIRNKRNKIYFSKILKESKKAYLFKIKEYEIWLPKSQITLKDTYIIVPNWLIKNTNIDLIINKEDGDLIKKGLDKYV